MAMHAIEPVTLTVTLTVTKATENGLLGGITAVEVTSVNGDADARFYGFSDYRGAMVLNFKEDGRPAKARKPEAAKIDKPAPKALTVAEKAMIPGPATKSIKGKVKVAAPAAPAAPDMAAIVAAVMAALGQK